jgi:hypothetical protein
VADLMADLFGRHTLGHVIRLLPLPCAGRR